ncbi:hypothetical protein DVH24_009183 [Malus domestica]|uniref:Malectin-like domain-containing protein n=1 Tax=Malus domestica TaxID=3750 RepID=A0A498JL63_MALDO|nr:hypothetical protein DVH24_009183 [Malus domestica]
MANLVPLLQLVNYFVALSSLPAIILLVTNIPSHADALFISIYCGWNGSSSYRDENSIVWTRDDAYVHNKDESQVFQQYYYSNTEGWTNTKKNCYTIPVDKAGERLLVRANFSYFNYNTSIDSPAPTFELQFDGNFWATVVTELYNIVSYEAIYVSKANTTSICLAQIKDDQLPFISALELRSLDFEMYSRVDSNHALLLGIRVTAGIQMKHMIEFGNRGVVLYLRRVSPVMLRALILQDNPPVAVLQNAVTTTSTIWALVLDTELPHDNRKVDLHDNLLL